MLTIRNEQIAVLARYALEVFEEQMVEHLRDTFPVRCRAMGEPTVRELIRCGIERAARYDLHIHQDICKFITLMFVYGRTFDEDPELPWVSEVLQDGQIVSPTAKINYIYEKASQRQHSPR